MKLTEKNLEIIKENIECALYTLNQMINEELGVQHYKMCALTVKVQLEAIEKELKEGE